MDLSRLTDKQLSEQLDSVRALSARGLDQAGEDRDIS